MPAALRLPILALGLLLFCGAAWAVSFPTLSGRVVDGAHILSLQAVNQLTTILEDQEKRTGQQIVVATVPNLQGLTIEDYGYQLGRFWGIGQKGKNNGIILLVAPQEHKVRIEVGYGLEGQLTDAQSSIIIQQVILPDFKKGQMELGIVQGTHALLLALNNSKENLQVMTPSQAASNNSDANIWIPPSVVLIIFFYIFLRILACPPVRGHYLGSGFGPGFGGFSGSGGGGFSGGGGSFGGGGASGGW